MFINALQIETTANYDDACDDHNGGWDDDYYNNDGDNDVDDDVYSDDNDNSDYDDNCELFII